MVQKSKKKNEKNKNEDVIVEISSRMVNETDDSKVEKFQDQDIRDKKEKFMKKNEKFVSQKKVEELESELEKQKIAFDEMKDKYYRLAAEFDNFKKRMAKEFETINKYAGEKVLKEILTVFDDIVRAVENEPELENNESTGLGMIYKKFQKILYDMEVKPIEALGKEFNPDFHHALMVREEEGVEPDLIVEEFEKGYTFKEKVIKHSKVVVSR
ncbi:MAG: nucleotide exchange factor GrpE [Candidatus Marinimicrobia bacterium]|nr:nucleotide exchange factor GrpE [Candidatus Neomarinimicrobiota bacterium]